MLKQRHPSAFKVRQLTYKVLYPPLLACPPWWKRWRIKEGLNKLKCFNKII